MSYNLIKGQGLGYMKVGKSLMLKNQAWGFDCQSCAGLIYNKETHVDSGDNYSHYSVGHAFSFCRSMSVLFVC